MAWLKCTGAWNQRQTTASAAPCSEFLNTLLLTFLDESALGKNCVDLASDKIEHA